MFPSKFFAVKPWRVTSTSVMAKGPDGPLLQV
jgi:hypothetical protein